ncbi:MAG: hypothetical protein IIC75_03835 [Bacteroidetes bacterium]|nr:hypothetical protein [Bacteroidota bacterium]
MKLKLIIAALFSIIFMSNNYAALVLHHDDKDKNKHIHFAHPLITETPSPDTKIRFDYFYRNINSGVLKNHTTRLELEYAFAPSFSIEVDIPYTILKPSLGSTESNFNTISIGFKFANYAFEESNILLGYGLEFGIPTGDQDVGIGSNHILEIEPFFSIGYKIDKFDIIGYIAFGIPTNLDTNVGDEFETEFESNLSLMYHANENLQLLLELDRSAVINGDEAGTIVMNISPGIKFNPFNNPNIFFGISAGIPVTNTELFDSRIIGSVFYHFD